MSTIKKCTKNKDKPNRERYNVSANATSTVAKGKNGCNLRKMGIFVSNFEKYFVVWGCIL